MYDQSWETPSTIKRAAALGNEGAGKVFGNKPSYPKTNAYSFSPEDLIITLDDIEKGKLLGKGALCEVHKAYWKSGKMEVALKTFFVPDLIEEDLNDFKRELMLTRLVICFLSSVVECCVNREMAHPNVIHFLAGCAEPPNVYLIMELARHGTVSDLIHTEWEPLSFALRLRIAKDIACAMEFLHSKNVLHRDLKPENFLVRLHNHRCT